MIKTISLIFFSLGLGASAAGAATGSGVIAGDSLGEGVTMASHLPSFAKRSVSIRSGAAVEQIERAPAGSTVFLSLGTNDAVGNIDGLDGPIRRIVDAATNAQVKLVWIGPPCVFKPWDKNAIALDANLKQTLGGAADIVYVSMRDDRLCDRAIRAPDGVHFNMTGYHYMWQKAAAAAGYVAEIADATPSPDRAKHKAAIHKTKKHRKKKKKAAAPAADSAAPAPSAAQPGSPSQ